MESSQISTYKWHLTREFKKKDNEMKFYKVMAVPTISVWK